MAVAGYNIYLNGVKKNTSLITDLSYVLSDLTASTSYDVTVSAVDTAGNESVPSSIANFTTSAVNAAYKFDGSAQNLSFANSADFVRPLSGAFTIGYRVKPTVNTGKFAVGVMSSGGRTWSSSWNKGGTGDDTYAADLAIFNSGGGGYIQQASQAINSLNAYYDVIGTYSGSGTKSGIKIFINGTQNAGPSGGSSAISTINNVGSFSAGLFPSFQTQNCHVDRLFYVNRDLTFAEITEAQTTKISDFSFLADVVDGWDFNSSLGSVKGTHNATATTPQYATV